MVRVFLPLTAAMAIVGVVGALQLDVLAARIKTEYGLGVVSSRAVLRSAAG